MSVLEKVEEEAVVNWAKRNGFLALKVRFAEAGYPDRLFISPTGHTIFIEFKRKGYAPDPLQRRRIADLQRRGVPAFWTDNRIEAISWLKEALVPAPVPKESSEVVDISSSGGPTDGPRTWEDELRAGGLPSSQGQGDGEADAGSGSAAGSADSMAHGDREVGGIPVSFLQRVTWEDEDDSPSTIP